MALILYRHKRSKWYESERQKKSEKDLKSNKVWTENIYFAVCVHIYSACIVCVHAFQFSYKNICGQS